MDEATSNLDSDTEDLFLDAISKLNRSVTIIYIAHRLHALKFFSRVVFLDKGTISFDGNLKDAKNKSPKLTRLLEKNGFNVESK
jgi:ATP-binding cassette subfamily C protein CydD